MSQATPPTGSGHIDMQFRRQRRVGFFSPFSVLHFPEGALFLTGPLRGDGPQLDRLLLPSDVQGPAPAFSPTGGQAPFSQEQNPPPIVKSPTDNPLESCWD